MKVAVIRIYEQVVTARGNNRQYQGIVAGIVLSNTPRAVYQGVF